MHRRLTGSLIVLLALPCAAFPVRAQVQAGAARVDITPDPAAIFEPYTSIHDHIFTRAIFVRDGQSSAVLINVDVGNLNAKLADALASEITARYGTPRQNIILSAVHIHSSVGNLGSLAPGEKELTPKMQAFVAQVHKGVLDAVAEAHRTLRPAEVGFGEGFLYLNVNRDGIDPKTRLWAQRPNPEGPSDKTMALVEFRDVATKQPIAFYMNYAMHAVTMFLRGDISGDFPDVASNYLEDVYGHGMVAVWTQGAEGDQNPLDMRPILAINEARIHQEMDPAKPGDPAEYNAAIMRLFLAGATRPELPEDPKLYARSWQVVEAIGVLAAEEALRIADGISTFQANAQIAGASTVLTCPGRTRLDNAREGVEGHYQDGPPASVSLSALRIGGVAIASINAEPYNKIGQEVKAASPFRDTMMVALAAGGQGGGYIPTDDAFSHYTFQALGTHFKPGCAETGIVEGERKMLDAEFNQR